MFRSLNQAKISKIVISGGVYGLFPNGPIEAVLDLRTVTDEPFQHGRAFSLEEGEPYLGSVGETAVYGKHQKYIQVWEVWIDFDGTQWLGRNARDYNGINRFLGLGDYPRITRVLKKLLVKS